MNKNILLTSLAAASCGAAYLIGKLSNKNKEKPARVYAENIREIDDVMALLSDDVSNMSVSDMRLWNVSFVSIQWDVIGDQSMNKEYLEKLIECMRLHQKRMQELEQKGLASSSWVYQESKYMDRIIYDANESLRCIDDDDD